MGLRVELFGSAHEFTQIRCRMLQAAWVLDIKVPGVGGLDFQAELAEADIRIPIIFMTAHGDIFGKRAASYFARANFVISSDCGVVPDLQPMFKAGGGRSPLLEGSARNVVLEADGSCFSTEARRGSSDQISLRSGQQSGFRLDW
jgi:DNA-binding NarL/FixJ family response regulator